jgi:hypothetical protein
MAWAASPPTVGSRGRGLALALGAHPLSIAHGQRVIASHCDPQQGAPSSETARSSALLVHGATPRAGRLGGR